MGSDEEYILVLVAGPERGRKMEAHDLGILREFCGDKWQMKYTS